MFSNNLNYFIFGKLHAITQTHHTFTQITSNSSHYALSKTRSITHYHNSLTHIVSYWLPKSPNHFTLIYLMSINHLPNTVSELGDTIFSIVLRFSRFFRFSCFFLACLLIFVSVSLQSFQCISYFWHNHHSAKHYTFTHFIRTFTQLDFSSKSIFQSLSILSHSN